MDSDSTSARLLVRAQRLAQVGSWFWDAATNHMSGSEEYYRILGIDADEAKILTPELALRHLHPDDRGRLASLWVKSTQRNIGGEVEYRVLWPDGSERVVRGDAQLEHDADGTVSGMLGIVHDITGRRRAEAALRQSEVRFAKAFHASPDAVTITLYDDGRFVDVNDGFTRITGYTAAEAIGKRSGEMGLWENAEDRRRMVEALRDTGSARDLAYRFRTKTGDWRLCHLSAESFTIDDVRYIVAISRDVTEQTRAAQALEASRQQLRDLTARLHAIREDERTAISREIHDELGQALTALKLDLAWLRDKLPPDGPTLTERVDSMLDLSGNILSSVRRISARLRPAVLDDLGLEAAIDWQTEAFARRTGIECVVDLGSAQLPRDSERETAVFRILQESLTNVARHADARNVWVSLESSDGSLTLRITDDGRGIEPPDTQDASSLGLLGMRERASAFDGRIEVSPRTGGGTEICLHMPISTDPAQDKRRTARSRFASQPFEDLIG